MKQVDFAELCGVSRQAISKHGQAGRLVIAADGSVDAKASLIRLEGHLDEGKRRFALMRLAGIDIPMQARSALGAPEFQKEIPDNQEADNVVPLRPSAKAQKDEVDLQLRQLELAERIGELVEAVDVKLAVEDAVATFWSEVDRKRRQTVDEIAGELMLDRGQASKLRRLIAKRDRDLRSSYSNRMHEMSAQFAPRHGDQRDESS